MTFLAGELITRKLIEPFDDHARQQASYDLRLGSDVYIVGDTVPKRLDSDEPYMILPPGQFAILTTFEWIMVPDNMIAFISLRNSFKMQGLVNISGFHVDPTFSGRIKFAVQNLGPNDLRLKLHERVFTIFFSRVEGTIIGKRAKDPDGITLKDVQLLGGGSITLSQMKKDIDRINLMLLVYAPFAAGAFITLLVLLYRAITE